MSALPLALLAIATSSFAHAAPEADLEVTLDLPTFDVDQAGTVEIDVENLGTLTATNVWLTVVFPQTNTSPTVHPMGTLSNLDSRCFDDHTQIKCNLTSIGAGASKTVAFDFALPQSAGDLEFWASAATNSTENIRANNVDTQVADVEYPDLIITGPATVVNEQCVGLGLSAFYECTLSPSSIRSHQITLAANGTVGFPSPYYTGTWVQPTDDSLWFEYRLAGLQRLVFEGNAVDGSCFEGLASFPGSPYVSPMRVCL